MKEERAKAQLSDKTLYDLCRNYPGHNDRAHAHAKIWLIARAMQTGIERQIKSDKTRTGSALDKLEQHIQHNRSEISNIFKELGGITGTLNEHNSAKIVSCHGRFVKFLSPILKKNKAGAAVAVPTFAAKYMHFHNPLVPIYDNDTKDKLTKLYPWKKSGSLAMPKNADREYFRFVERLRRLASELNLDLPGRCIRDLDHYLRVL